MACPPRLPCGAPLGVLLLLLLLVPGGADAAGAAATALCEVTFRNVAGSPMVEAEAQAGGEVRIFSAPSGPNAEVPLGDAGELKWEALRSAIDASSLRLRRLPGDVRGGGLREDAKLMALGAVDLWEHGPAALRRRLLAGASPPEPARLALRLDERVGSVRKGEWLTWNASCGQTFELEADGAEPVVVRIQRDGEVVFAVQGGWVRATPTSALLPGPKSVDNASAAPAASSWAEVREAMRVTCAKPFEAWPADAAYFCGPWQDHRFYVSSRYDHTETTARRQLQGGAKHAAQMALEQPRSLQNFTVTGFAVRQGPEEVVAKVRNFYLQQRLQQSHPEMSHAFNPTLSMYESDVWALNLSQGLRDELDAALRPLVAEWAGLELDSLLPPIIHGPRLYHNGSVLREHVDNLQTHAFGVIVHMGHLGLSPDEPEEAVRWPFVIVDHDGQAHTLSADTVGEVVLYESATCRHYREGPFLGREFANLFLHYAPFGWPETYLVGIAGGGLEL